MEIAEVLIIMGVPSAVTGFCFWVIEHRLQKRDQAEKEERMRRQQAEKEERMRRQQEQDEREAAKEENQFLIIKSVGAALALGEATAKAVQRIPDTHCNGDMHAALEYAQKVKHEQKDFLTKQGLQDLV